MSLTRVFAIIIRHYFMTLHHLERFFDVFIFPVMALVMWGFVTKYVQNVNSPGLASFLLGGLILWVVFERIETDLGISFMFDVWERNVVNFLATPLSFLEYILGIIAITTLKIVVSFIATFTAALVFDNFQVTSWGSALALFGVNLIMSAMAFGLLNITLVMRFGHGIGPLTWILPFLLQPFSAVFYPVSILPEAFQKIAYVIPMSHIFEGMRYTLKYGQLNSAESLIATILSILYLSLSILLFSAVLSWCKSSGRLVKLN